MLLSSLNTRRCRDTVVFFKNVPGPNGVYRHYTSVNAFR